MMYNNNSCSNSASTARGLMTLCAGLAMGLGLGLMASPAEADVYAYVANDRSNNVSVIDTTTTPPVRGGYGRGGGVPLWGSWASRTHSAQRASSGSASSLLR